MKITLFLCAGLFAETLGVHRVRELNGIGRRMPLSMIAFTIGALGMIGVPPIAGFISKWYLGLGALESGQTWVLWVLIISGILNAAYFLPLVYRGWFLPPDKNWPVENFSSGQRISLKLTREAHWMLLIPALFTALLSLLAGIFAGTDISPLNWAQLIIDREFDL